MRWEDFAMNFNITRGIVLGLLLMLPEMGNEVHLWTITPTCAELTVQGCKN